MAMQTPLQADCKAPTIHFRAAALCLNGFRFDLNHANVWWVPVRSYDTDTAYGPLRPESDGGDHFASCPIDNSPAYRAGIGLKLAILNKCYQ